MLCGDDRHLPLEDAPRLIFDGRCSTVVRCRACGLCYTSPRPSAETIHRFYEGYEPHQHCGLTPSRRRHLAGGLDLDRLKFWHLSHPQRYGLPRRGQGRLLDFGCGGGEFLELMHLRGWRVLGLDACGSVIERIRGELKFPALAGTLPHAEIPPEGFDLVTMWQALEHVHQPIEVLRQAWRALAPGGKLVVGVPNLAGAPRRWFRAAWCGWRLPHHLTHFTPATLRQMVERAGFQTERVWLPPNAAWLRESAETALRLEPEAAWRRWLTSRFVARRVVSYLYLTRQSDEMVLTAIKRTDGQRSDS
jgi:2-polyprenyl-3-methyl-5-hydroxy-6-metoxy-1,4-benzoquinol methylase